MPRKRRTGPLEITAAVRMAVHDVAAWERHFGSAAAARDAWRASGTQLVVGGAERPAVWWYYCDDAPEELRTAPERPDPRAVLAGPPSPSYARAARTVEMHARARLEWLVWSGHLDAAEVAQAQRALAITQDAE